MREFKDPTRVGRAATIALYAYMVTKALVALLRFTTGASNGDPLLGVASLGFVVALIASYILVGMWIYRANANAHSFSSDMSITPGWSIGWFFVPFACLVMPYRGVQETWRESHERAGRFEEVDSSLLGWWWGLWIASNILSNFVVFSGGYSADALGGAVYVNLVVAAVSVATGLVLIQLIRRLNGAQLAASNGSVFA
jgi:hypothetical protein